jgi:2-(1,2-epoxy-1,2-dihydrophenyl)acetyl-CoA isomerase
VTLEQRDGVAWITLQRPESLNAWDTRLPVHLLEAVEAVDRAPTVRAVCLRGAGRGFSSGFDMRAERYRRADGVPDSVRSLREHCNPIIAAIRQTPKPVVAAVNGPAAGIGCSLALACDFVIAAESAFFVLAFARVGLMPDGGALPLTVARVGLTRALELAMLGDRLSARAASDIGLINRVVADIDFDDQVGRLVTSLAQGPTAALAAIKRAVNACALGALPGALEAEPYMQQQLAAGRDHKEGVAAFLERRVPEFLGE